MFDMMLGPCGATFWKGSGGAHPLPRSRFHMDWSRVAYPVGITANELNAFSYAIGDQGPAAVIAAIGATQADIFDTSISKPDALSRTCIATHMGVTIDRSCLVNAADVLITIADMRIAFTRICVRVFWAERTNEEVVGLIEDFPEGIGMEINDQLNANVWNGEYNGVTEMSAIKPLPKPLPCKGGDTYFRVTFEPSYRDAGAQFGAITSLTARVYGVAPAKVQPGEAPRKAMQALGLLGA